jgi:hypothetical protein
MNQSKPTRGFRPPWSKHLALAIFQAEASQVDPARRPAFDSLSDDERDEYEARAILAIFGTPSVPSASAPAVGIDEESAHQQIERLASERDHYKEIVEKGLEPQLRKMSVESGVFDMEFTGDAAKATAASLVGYYKGIGARNYIEMSFFDPDEKQQRYIVTVQRVDGKSPADKVREAEARVAELEAKLAVFSD